MAPMNRKRFTAAMCSLATLAVAAAAFAVKAKPKLRGAPELKASLPLWAIVCALVALGGICVVAFKSSKRTHLD